ncbi:hypothetical protein Salat_2048100 [Sesamum alatum]|uniref:Uncharacterized protein n=1 Tax=Sesamum alatum TaxID=300844 RepID=A0AAE1Y0G7_9LAMI|nr:hypothetical protein Salat_2048100 [Sesamum alatum]
MWRCLRREEKLELRLQLKHLLATHQCSTAIDSTPSSASATENHHHHHHLLHLHLWCALASSDNLCIAEYTIGSGDPTFMHKNNNKPSKKQPHIHTRRKGEF